MRITWLLEATDQLWGGIKVALEDANWLHRRGHQVTVLSRTGRPAWMQIECAFRQVQDFRAEHLPPGDVVIGTFWSTVPWAACAGTDKGVAVHFCQGYEGDFPENGPLRDRIEAAYRLPNVRHLTIAPHLTRLLTERFRAKPTELVHVVDHTVHTPGPARSPGSVLRVGLVGPWQVGWKDLATGFAACELAHRAGQKLVLVRATNTGPDAKELSTPFPVEWHQKLPPSRMGDFYRSLDLFLGTSSGSEEGFFLPAIEAMACGVPTVLTDVPCFRDHEQTGVREFALFVPPRNPAAMAEAIVVAGGMPDVRHALRKQGLELAQRYTQDAHGAALEAALQSFVTASANERPSLKLVGGPDLDECIDPTDARLQLAAASACMEAGDTAGALQIYDALVASGCDDEAVHAGRGHALHARGRLREAADAFRTALAIGTRCADSYNRLGVVLFQAGDVRGARHAFERALLLQPDHGDALANLAALPAA